MVKTLIQYKNGEQLLVDKKAVISIHAYDLIEDSVDLSKEELIILTQAEEKASIEGEEKKNE